MAKTMRLDKLLGHTGWGTRRELKELCKGGHVTVNGAVCRDSSQKIDPAADAVAVDGQAVYYEESIYLMCSTSRPASYRLRKTTCRRRSSASCRASTRGPASFP